LAELASEDDERLGNEVPLKILDRKSSRTDGTGQVKRKKVETAEGNGESTSKRAKLGRPPGSNEKPASVPDVRKSARERKPVTRYLQVSETTPTRRKS